MKAQERELVDFTKVPWDIRLRYRVIWARYLASIWAMLAAASLAAAFFQGSWLFGLPFGLFCINMVIKISVRIAEFEAELEKWKSSQASTSSSDMLVRSQ